MTNGSNDWGVSFSAIQWLDNFLRGHKNISSVERNYDILFSVRRKLQKDDLGIVCLNQYTMGLTATLGVISEFKNVNIIYLGGGWCGYTYEAKEYCIQNRVGLFIASELSAALWQDNYWAFVKKDNEGNSFFYYKS